jgi:hypothetical protein
MRCVSGVPVLTLVDIRHVLTPAAELAQAKRAEPEQQRDRDPSAPRNARWPRPRRAKWATM